MARRSVGWVVAFVLTIASPAFAQERFGSLSGRITDASGASLPGVSVVTTNRGTLEVRTFVTDGGGLFNAPDLVPGRYDVRFDLPGFRVVERQDVSVVLGRAFALNLQLAIGAVTEVVQVRGEAAPLIDLRSTLVAHNVSAEEMERLPKTRTFQSIAVMAPSVNAGEIEGGLQVGGASGAENTFTVDGIVTNSLINGQSRQNTVFEYLQEVQVKTSGISAEYGGALGGVLSAVTRSGGNTFRGETHYYFQGSALSAAPVRRLVLDPFLEETAFYVRDRESPEHHQEFGGSAGGPIVKDRLFFFGSFSPRNERQTNSYTYLDGTQDIQRRIWRQQAFGKVSYSTGRVQAHGSVLWTPTTATGILEAFEGVAPNSVNTTRASSLSQIERGYELNQVTTSGTLDLALWRDSLVSVRGGVFHDRYSDRGIPLTTSYTYGTSTESVNALLPANLRGPSGLVNTPATDITEFDTTIRRSLNVDVTRVFHAGGNHSLKGGYGLQRTVNDINTYYPGGYVNIFWGRPFQFGGSTLGTGTYGYYEVSDRRKANKAGNNIHSLYVQDQWTLGSRLTLNLGLRSEDETVPTFRPDYLENAFHFTFADKLAPRLGAAFDVRGDGRMKIFGSWGLYYDWTKYELPRGSFGAESWCTFYRSLDTLDLGSLNLSNMPGRDLWVNPGSCRDRRVPSFGGSIDPLTEPMKQASTSAGLEFQVSRNAVVTARYIHNDLLEAIEDIGFLNDVGNLQFLIGNPGKRATATQFPSGATPSGQPVPRPMRVYDALELGINRRLADRYFFSANYTLSRLYGNYSGLASSDEIVTPTRNVSWTVAQQPTGSIGRPGGNVVRAWDQDELFWDSRGNLDVRGRLATDRPHVVKLYGSYDLPFGSQIGAFFYGASGTPISTYVTSTHGADMFVFGRGDMGRTPALTRTDLLLTHTVALGPARRMRFELNVTNLFNQQTTRHLFNYLNKGGIVPGRSSSFIDLANTDLSRGYDVNALIRATADGAAAVDPRYAMPDLFEDGTRGYVTVKLLF